MGLDAHVQHRDRDRGGEEEHHADEDHPRDGDDVDRPPPAAERVLHAPVDVVERVAVQQVREDDGHVRQVERGRGHVEDGRGRLRAADGDQVQHHRAQHHQPHGVDGRGRVAVDPAPDPARAGIQSGAIASEGAVSWRGGQQEKG